MLYREDDIKNKALMDIASKMALGARTAPKGRGQSNIIISIVEGDTIKQISEKLKDLGKQYDVPSFKRDAENILQAPVMLLLGTKINPLRLKKCGMCGFENCEAKDKYPMTPCVFNTGDLGIALGSAVSIASDYRIDNRIMYTVGIAVVEMKLLGDDVKIVYAIPLSATSKNPFFDRA